MVRANEAAMFHKQLVQQASQKLRDIGYRPVQHVAIEGGGRPDVSGRNSQGKYEIIVECLLRGPTKEELRTLRIRYKGRRIVLAIPQGMPLDTGHTKGIDVWEFAITRDGKVILPVGDLEVDPILWDAISSHIRSGEIGRGQIVRLLLESLKEKIDR